MVVVGGLAPARRVGARISGERVRGDGNGLVGPGVRVDPGRLLAPQAPEVGVIFMQQPQQRAPKG